MSSVVGGENGVRLRRADPGDVDFLVGLVTHDDVEPFLGAVTAREPDAVRDEVERSAREPQHFGRFVIELDEGARWRRAGALGFEVANRRSRIAHLERLAVDPEFRGRALADRAAALLQRHLIFDLGYHRLQLEIYAFNERAIHHAERSGFVREGVRRKAYWRHGEWVDAVMFGLVREDLEDGSAGDRAGIASAMDDERSLEEQSRDRLEQRIDEAAGEQQADPDGMAERMQDEQDPEQNEP